mgnify:CR=1 FL=1
MTEIDPSPLRVLHVINGEYFSGAERVQDLLAQRLPECGYEVGFACLKPGLFVEKRTSRTPLYAMPMNGRFDLGLARRIAQLVRREGYAAVHAHTPRSALLGRPAALLARVPFIYHVHSPTARDTTHRFRNLVNSATERLSLCGAAALVAVSESLGNQMRAAGYAASRVHVVPNGVPVVEAEVNRATPQSEWVLGAVALFRPRKGTEVLLQAIAALRAEGVPVRLRCIGPFETPGYEAELKSMAAELGIVDAVEWTGFTSDVNAELRRLDLFVLPSLFGEGLPMVVLEAMAVGLPVIGTRVEGVPEAVRDGEEGLLVKPGCPVELAGAISRFVSGEVSWRSLGANALARQRERFSDRSMAQGLAAVYDSVLSPRPKREPVATL